MDRDDAQPGEDRIALGLTAQEDRPRRLAGVLDELSRPLYGACDGTVELAMMAPLQLVFVPACVGVWGVGRGLHEPRSG
jgi:hypothetical protein